MNLLRRGKHPVEDMQNDYNTYGEVFEGIILEEFSPKDFDGITRKEGYWQHAFNTKDRSKGYNYKDVSNKTPDIDKFKRISLQKDK